MASLGTDPKLKVGLEKYKLSDGAKKKLKLKLKKNKAKSRGGE